MKNEQQFDVWKNDLEPVLSSKTEEFQLMGYDKATNEEVWQCVMHKVKKKKEFIRFHALVNEIFTLRVSDYMNQLTIEAYKGPDLLSSSYEDELGALLGEVEKPEDTRAD
ncbi:post-transcriptional regulator [Thalassobacillus sp. C254]|uniref:post-transcriptional regulator n=1 Tax=Thalassobacillus sp. C254 TaxID=1225341 RepID=UPI0006D14B0B|nr:post-transcriptional regulator [Thalassobacillus sp. C254]